MKISKGLITAAGDRERRIPLQTLVDRDGSTRTVLAMLVNEIASAGVSDICIVIPPGEREPYANAVPDQARRITFIEQTTQSGYAGAIACAKEHLANEPFLHLVGDHVYINGSSASENRGSRAAQLVQLAEAQGCSVSAVQATHESSITRFGVIGGTPIAGQPSLYKIDAVVEKPTPTLAEQRLIVSGLRAAYYLAFFGMHVFTPTLLEILSSQMQSDASTASVSGSLDRLAAGERYLGWQVLAYRYDLGPRYGLLNAQLALALDGEGRDEVLSSLVGLLAAHNGSHLRFEESAQ